MIPIIVSSGEVYVDAALVNNATNQLGRLTGARSAEIYERLNGEYTAEIRISREALHASKLQRFGLVKLKANQYHPLQLFRINRVKRSLVEGDIILQLNHIAYDLNKLPSAVFTATGITEVVNTFNGLAGRVSYMPFTMSSNLTNETSVLQAQVPTPWRTLIGGSEGSILDVFGGEIEWNNLSVNILQNRGQYRNIAVRYGVNLIELTQEENIANTYSAAVGYAADENDNVIVGGVVSDGVGRDYPLIRSIDLTGSVPAGSTVTQALVTQLTEEWVAANHPATPQIGMTVDFKTLRDNKQHDLLSQLEDIRLGDTVDVLIPEMEISQEAKVTGVRYDCLNERITQIELGNYRPRLASTISDINKRGRSAALSAYPVGSLYSTYGNQNPAATIGGIWTLVSTSGGLKTYRRTR